MRLLLLFAAAFSLMAQPKAPVKTVIKDAAAAQKLLGEHRLQLQWIAYESKVPGKAAVVDEGGVWKLKGQQKDAKGNSVTVDGIITEVAAKTFAFEGTIVTTIDHINAGQPCVRKGKMSFLLYGARPYWRLTQIQNPCDSATDYVDLFLR
jgi:hypothetical protein